MEGQRITLPEFNQALFCGSARVTPPWCRPPGLEIGCGTAFDRPGRKKFCKTTGLKMTLRRLILKSI